MPFNARLILVPAVLLALSGCAKQQFLNAQGYITDPELVASVQPGVDNKDSVEKALGRPTMVSQWDGNSWYYVSRVTRQLAFARPTPRSQEILVVRFAADGTVAGVEKRGLEKVANLVPNKDKTPTLGHEESLFEDLFGNIGSVGAGAPAGGGGPQ